MLNYLSFVRLDAACYELHEHGYAPLKTSWIFGRLIPLRLFGSIFWAYIFDIDHRWDDFDNTFNITLIIITPLNFREL